MRRPLTQREEIRRAQGIAAFCKGAPFNTNKNEAWILGWKEMAEKFRSRSPIPKCAAITSTMDRRCMRAATVGNLCQLHAKISPRKLRRVHDERKSIQNETAARQENHVGAVRCELPSTALPETQPTPIEPARPTGRPYSETCPYFEDHMKATLEAIIEHREFSWCMRAKQRNASLAF